LRGVSNTSLEILNKSIQFPLLTFNAPHCSRRKKVKADDPSIRNENFFVVISILGYCPSNGPSSSFKKQLASLKIGDTIMTSSAAGDFVLPKNTTKKLVFIAGGIGVTPFRSMVQHLLDTKEKRDIVTLYSVRTLADIAYKEMFETAKAQLGMRTEYLVTDKTCVPPGWNTPTGYICEPTIKQLVPDFAERTFYISGPFMMVEAAQKELRKMGVKRSQIMTDFFPGFAG
jgi:ferredoxin-NADP reductase